MIFLRIKIEILSVIKNFYQGMFIKYASKDWLDNKAYDYGKIRKQATKAQGYLTVIKVDETRELVIPKGYVFKTNVNAGKEYKFLSTEKTVIEANKKQGKISIIADNVGSSYNVQTNSITEALVHLENIESYKNEDEWLIKEGSDLEDDESFRNRVLNVWSELSVNPTATKYKNVAESVEGVLYALVDDMHPRGQGSVDVIIATQNGSASEKLIKDVETALDGIKGVYDNALVKSAEIEKTNVNVTLYIDKNTDDTGLTKKATEHIKEYFKVKTNKKLNILYLSELIFHIRKNIDVLTAVKILEPTVDLMLDKNKVIVLNEITVTIERV